MALFKILNNFDSGSTALPQTYVQGYCYFDKNTGKFWVDTTNAAAGRMALNAYKADIAVKLQTARDITIGATTHAFDGTTAVSWTLAEIGALARAAAGATNQGIYINSSGNAVAMDHKLDADVPADAVFTDTHWTTKLIVGKSTSTANAATTAGEETYLRLFDNNTNRASLKILGAGGTTITSDSSGNVTITSRDNNTTYTFTDGTDGTFSVRASGATADQVVSTGVPAVAHSAEKLDTARTIDGVSFDGSANIIHYGVCSSAADATTKVVDCTGFSLTNGAWIAVRFANTNTAAVGSLLLNVNNTGAKAIKYRGGNLSDKSNLAANGVYLFVYDSTNDQYHRVGDINTNTTYSALSQADATGGTATTARLITAKVLNDTIVGKISALDGNTNNTTPGAGKTVTQFSEIDGVVSIKFEDISITKSQISDFPSSFTPASHTHGNIQNGGTLQTNDISVANGDKLVVTDSSDSAKVARTSISFDGSTTDKALTPKGTWETFLQSHQSLAAYAKIASPTFTGTPEAPTAAAGTNTTQIATTAFVMNAVSGVSGPMVYKGTLGTGGTITSLPSADTSNLGFVYKVITEETYASQPCKIGDMWISNGTVWTYIPSGDDGEISMAVTNEVLTFSYGTT